MHASVSHYFDVEGWRLIHMCERRLSKTETEENYKTSLKNNKKERGDGGGGGFLSRVTSSLQWNADAREFDSICLCSGLLISSLGIGAGGAAATLGAPGSGRSPRTLARSDAVSAACLTQYS